MPKSSISAGRIFHLFLTIHLGFPPFQGVPSNNQIAPCWGKRTYSPMMLWYLPSNNQNMSQLGSKFGNYGEKHISRLLGRSRHKSYDVYTYNTSRIYKSMGQLKHKGEVISASIHSKHRHKSGGNMLQKVTDSLIASNKQDSLWQTQSLP